MNQNKTNYQSFLLRLWRAEDHVDSPWLAMLENPHTGERVGFSDVTELQQFLSSFVTKTESESEERKSRISI